MTKIHAARLLKLATFLQRHVAPAGYNQGVFYQAPTGDCGKQACALGWACTLEDFRRRGLRVDETFGPTYTSPTSTVSFGVAAGRRFFELTLSEADYLFADASPRYGVDGINAFVDLAIEVVTSHYNLLGTAYRTVTAKYKTRSATR